uniref:NADH-ubiquinone oxidoreductase chain 4 n=13 Tax=Nicrophorus TaxID=57515 RepID=A0A8A5RFN6_NICNE|nr:NADH dehydrogenase subunit 4 [Nicrophorus nepalensis]QTG39876.1 NADH dehydrogenase subunit 4 [Nicrophorus nepalensis]
MMKMLFIMLFMIPLNFKSFWLNQFMYFVMTILFMQMFSSSFLVTNLSYVFGVDLLSWVMILLSFWICSLMILASYKLFKNNQFSHLMILVVTIMLIALYCTFSVTNLFLLYFFFEVSLIPVLILILGWGYQPERLQAGIYLMFYTLIASLPMLISIFYYYNINYSLMLFYNNVMINEFMFFICMIMVFLVKMPMYFVHLWLPKAHVEAPVAGSMILAGIMLKLGGYGLMRVMMMFMEIGMKVSYLFMIISLLGGVFTSLVCLRQIDMKSLIAYSSVGHMGLALGGIFTYNYWGMCGALMMMVAHGLCSSALFCLVNISYERISSRSLFLNKGLINIMPSLSLWWFMFLACNMAAPPSLNLLSEILLINSLVSWCSLNMIFLAGISFLSAAYSLYLYAFSQHGMLFSGVYSFSLNFTREFLLMILHWIPLNFFILKSDILLLWL